MRKLVASILILESSLSFAEKIRFSSDHCNIYFDTRKHAISYEEKCTNYNGRKYGGLSFKCYRKFGYDPATNTFNERKGTNSVEVFVIGKSVSFLAVDENKENIAGYNIADFALDVNSGVFEYCQFHSNMAIESE